MFAAPKNAHPTPTRVATTYALLAATWLVTFDLAVGLHSGMHTAPLITDLAKAVLFVGFTTVLLFRWARHLDVRARDEAAALAEARARSDRARQMYVTLSAVNRRIIRAEDGPSLMRELCAALVDPGQFSCAAVAQVESGGGSASVVACAGAALPDKVPLVAGPAEPFWCIGEAVRSGRPVCAPDLPQPAAGWTAGHAAVALPVHAAGGVLILTAFRAGPGSITSEVMMLMAELAADLKYALEAIRERQRRAAAEAALRAIDERYRLVTENSRDVIWILGRDRRLVYISPSIERLLGYTPEQITELPFDAFVAPACLARVNHELTEALAQCDAGNRGFNRLLEIQQVRADGSRVWTEAHATPCCNRAGDIIGLLGVTRDITERRVAEQTVAAEGARYRAILDVSVDGIHLLDLDGRLLEANDTFLHQRGYTRAEAAQLTIEHWITDDTAAAVRQRLGAISATPVRIETRHRRKNGTVFDVEVIAVAVELQSRRVICASARDITERKEFEKRLLRAQRLESVGLIASGIAHDLNNVLTPILLSIGMLESRYRTVDDRKLLTPIEQSARRGSNIIQQILTFARGAEGQRVTLEPRVLLKELSNLIRETFPRNIQHVLTIEPDAHPISGDPTQLHQVFLNLAVNARDAMPNGGTLSIEVRNRRIEPPDLGALPAGRPGDYVCVSVTDTGTGITPDVLDHLFEPFFTTKPRGRGTGLGLSTVHGLVRSHGGFVEVSSAIGHGSSFRVFLPLSGGRPAIAEPAPRRRERPGRGQNILVVDDEPAILNVTETVLRQAGFNPISARDGEAALNLFETRGDEIALLITDVMMPNIDGIRLAAEVRRRNPHVPIIAMSGLITAHRHDDSRQQLRDLGVTVILDKPYGEAEMLAAISRMLSADGGTTG